MHLHTKFPDKVEFYFQYNPPVRRKEGSETEITQIVFLLKYFYIKYFHFWATTTIVKLSSIK